MSELLQRAAERVQDSMDEILANFKPGAKITVLVRTPNKPTADFCMTDDDLDEVVAMVRRRKGDSQPPQDRLVGKAEAFDRILAARKKHIEAGMAYNARRELVEAERSRGNWSMKLDAEYRTMSDAQSAYHRVVQDECTAFLATSASEVSDA